MLSLFNIALNNYIENKASYKELSYIQEKVSNEINRRKNISLLQDLLYNDNMKILKDKVVEINTIKFGEDETLYIVKFIGDNIIKCRTINFEYDDNLHTSVFYNSNNIGYGGLTDNGYDITLKRSKIQELFTLIGIEDCDVAYDTLSTFLLNFIYNESITGVVYCDNM
ncbi:Hypothetical protein ORPV_861 [Orpheovirus IHUMI-LCC2]|uniref:Uncharacterized protein n=1 Tax=Orpheovirus IHUMI-LCC2 TaxID=2023057 RepID=A0A2I2L5D3_9VIRU|nr:Hypothetical protein ORPV_861 [Orpheovirus IHUMI-LCC2]SNW62765.1 Hypothetical protein ORPV_861 [Orpheovirus IHUMI-LCC2]